MPQYYSQFGQDKFLDTKVFKGFRDGIYMDIGAHDGISLNNTLYFERELGWRGVNIEPNPDVYEKLLQNRPNSACVKCAVSSENGTAEFLVNTGYTEMLSGLKHTYDKRHLERIETEEKTSNSSHQTIQVDTRRFDTICENLGINRIHYLSIDVEGAEFDVIQSIDFSKVFIDVIDFENNYKDKSKMIVDYLHERGYFIIHPGADILMLHHKSPFNPFNIQN
jgi:FkbM family methyltransferase